MGINFSYIFHDNIIINSLLCLWEGGDFVGIDDSRRGWVM